MNFFYINKSIHIIFIFLIFALWVFGLGFILLPVLFLYAVLLYLFRRKRGVFKENPSIAEGVLYSPANGKVVSIKPDCEHQQLESKVTEIVIRVPWTVEYGVYLPFTSEVKDLLVMKGRDFFRYNKGENIKFQDRAGLIVSLKSQKGDEIGLQLIKCPAGLWPEIKVMPGDRGKRQANIGLMPFGGTLALYIPASYEILVQRGQDVAAGVSLIAGQQD